MSVLEFDLFFLYINKFEITIITYLKRIPVAEVMRNVTIYLFMGKEKGIGRDEVIISVSKHFQ